MNPTIHVRAAENADVSVIVHMSNDLACEEGCTDIVRATLQDWQRDLYGPQPRFAVVLAEHGGEIAGMLIYGKEFYPGWVDPAIKIHDLYVVPNHRRQRVATTLLEHITNFARESRAALVHLNVRAANPARGFYSQAGFQQLPECLTYLMALPAIQKLTEAAGTLAGLELPSANLPGLL